MEEIPIYQKITITIEETNKLTGIGRKPIEKLIKEPDCDFFLKIGTKTLIKREKFVDYINKRTVI